MATVSTAGDAIRHQARSAGHRAAHSDKLEWIARIGYATKGVVYGLVGVLALQVAFGVGGSTDGSKGAIREIGQQPFGQVLLGLTLVGLVAYAIWRFTQAAMDVDNEGSDTKAIIKRIGYGISGLMHAALALWTGRLLMGTGGGSGGQGAQTWTAKVMAQPWGLWLVGIAGLVIIGVGLAQFYRAYSSSFMRKYKQAEMNDKEQRIAHRMGQFGLAARGVVFSMIGTFLVQAAMNHNPQEARGLGGSLATLAQQSYGPWLLGLVAAGLVAYAVHCFGQARYRRVPANG